MSLLRAKEQTYLYDETTMPRKVVTHVIASDAVVFIATAWGPKYGGINAFNMDLAVLVQND